MRGAAAGAGAVIGRAGSQVAVGVGVVVRNKVAARAETEDGLPIGWARGAGREAIEDPSLDEGHSGVLP